VGWLEWQGRPDINFSEMTMDTKNSILAGDAASKKNDEADDPLVGARPDWWWAAPRIGPGDVFCEKAPRLDKPSREAARRYFVNGWALGELMFSALQGAGAFARAPDHGLRHPMIFYYGHTAALFVNKLRVAGLLDDAVNEEFERIFEVGVDEMSWDDMSKNAMEWPAAREVARYRQKVFDLVMELIRTRPELDDGAEPIGKDSPLWALFMAMEHDRIHLETSSVLLREMPLSLLALPEGWPSARRALEAPLAVDLAPDAEPSFARVEGGAVSLGKPEKFPTYGWDNEYGSRVAQVAPFEASEHMVTNAQFLRFVKEGGYAKERYWTAEGWRWRAFANAKHPKFWVERGPSGLGDFAIRTVFEVVDWAPDWPACVNFHEAKAYLAWRSERDGATLRLPTEAEHAAMRRAGAPALAEGAEDSSTRVDSGGLLSGGQANACLSWGSEVSVGWARPNALGLTDAFGNLWDWCEDDFHPLEGFEAHPFYEDFSSPCFDGRHAMILGGSFMSSGAEISEFARFHFRRHFHQHAGLRLIRSSQAASGAVKLSQSGAKYDQRSVLDQYLLFHYGDDDLALPAALKGSDMGGFPRKVARRLLAAARKEGVGFGRALDVGCAVGGSSFELARACAEVVGVDLSEPFVDAAKALSRGEALEYQARVEGDLSVSRQARAPVLAADALVDFRQGDACDLDASLEGFDMVLGSNLLCRLPDPKAFLKRLGGPRGLVRPGGVLALASPLSWMEQFTPKGAWLGGFMDGQGPRGSFEGLRDALGDEFELVERDDMPFMIREHGRKFEYVVSDLTIWRRKK
jgi:5-histidylcysteine sulfoxide synthase/putative 4-mercaptohistidine N1-methyltranferase